MHDGLQGLSRAHGQASGQEKVVKSEQIRLSPVFEQLGAFARRGQRVTGELGISLQVAYIVALQRGLVGQCLGQMAFADAGLAHDQGVGALSEKLEDLQLQPGRVRQLGVNLNPAVGRLLAHQTLYESNTCAHDGLHLRGEALHGRRSAASGLWRCCSHPPDRQSGVHSRLA